jgi:hypothetical protein
MCAKGDSTLGEGVPRGCSTLGEGVLRGVTKRGHVDRWLASDTPPIPVWACHGGLLLEIAHSPLKGYGL